MHHTAKFLAEVAFDFKFLFTLLYWLYDVLKIIIFFTFLFKLFCQCLKGIVSQDWEGLQMILLDILQVLNVSMSSYFLFLSAFSYRIFNLSNKNIWKPPQCSVTIPLRLWQKSLNKNVIFLHNLITYNNIQKLTHPNVHTSILSFIRLCNIMIIIKNLIIYCGYNVHFHKRCITEFKIIFSSSFFIIFLVFAFT